MVSQNDTHFVIAIHFFLRKEITILCKDKIFKGILSQIYLMLCFLILGNLPSVHTRCNQCKLVVFCVGVVAGLFLLVFLLVSKGAYA